jgi:hypothetical protein
MENTNFFSLFLEKLYKSRLEVVNYFQNLILKDFEEKKKYAPLAMIILFSVFVSFYINLLQMEANANPLPNQMTNEEIIRHSFNWSYFFPIDNNEIAEIFTWKSLVEDPYLEDIYIPEKSPLNLEIDQNTTAPRKNLYFIIYEQFMNDFFNYYFSFFIFTRDLIYQINLEAEVWNKEIILYYIFYEVMFNFYFSLHSFNLTDKIFSSLAVDMNQQNIIYNFATWNALYTNFNVDTSSIQITDLYYLYDVGQAASSSIFFNDFVLQILKTSIVNQIFYLQVINFYLKKKIVFFFFLNFLMLILMLINLTKLYKAINLIYALLHFLVFAVLSGLLILLWGSSYIAFCVLLIYGAAIPVLALYIIMLVNVDLIQRLFFFEHMSTKLFAEKKKKLIILILSFFFLLFSFQDITSILYERKYPWLAELMKDVFFTNLTEKYLAAGYFSYKTTTIYDLALSFYSSDIDKVASLAFKVSYNELLALVFLLLIAIIVVISISRSQFKTSFDYYDVVVPNYFNFKKNFDFMTIQTLYRFVYIRRLRHFIKNRSLSELHGSKLHSLHNPIYLFHYIYQTHDFTGFDTKTKDMHTRLAIDPEPYNPWDPWTEWYKVYNKEYLGWDLDKKPEITKFLYDEIDFTDRESFTKEEILFHRTVHRTLL